MTVMKVHCDFLDTLYKRNSPFRGNPWESHKAKNFVLIYVFNVFGVSFFLESCLQDVGQTIASHARQLLEKQFVCHGLRKVTSPPRNKQTNRLAQKHSFSCRKYRNTYFSLFLDIKDFSAVIDSIDADVPEGAPKIYVFFSPNCFSMPGSTQPQQTHPHGSWRCNPPSWDRPATGPWSPPVVSLIGWPWIQA